MLLVPVGLQLELLTLGGGGYLPVHSLILNPLPLVVSLVALPRKKSSLALIGKLAWAC